MNDSQNRFDERERPEKREHILWDSVYLNLFSADSAAVIHQWEPELQMGREARPQGKGATLGHEGRVRRADLVVMIS